jgi:GntR family transcriptional regulator
MTLGARFLYIAPSSGVPIYRQITDQVRAHISTGLLARGAFLPSVRQVAAVLTINPMTVSKAYSLLERDGLVELVRGQGMRVVGERHDRRRLSDRREVVRLVRRLVKRGRAAGLDAEELCALIHSTFEEFEHERIRPVAR